MKMKANARSYQQQVEWANPPSRVKQVLDSAARAVSEPTAPARKGNKKQRRSTSGAIRGLSESLTGLAAEWNTEADTAWVWKDNCELTILISWVLPVIVSSITTLRCML